MREKQFAALDAIALEHKQREEVFKDLEGHFARRLNDEKVSRETQARCTEARFQAEKDEQEKSLRDMSELLQAERAKRKKQLASLHESADIYTKMIEARFQAEKDEHEKSLRDMSELLQAERAKREKQMASLHESADGFMVEVKREREAADAELKLMLSREKHASKNNDSEHDTAVAVSLGRTATTSAPSTPVMFDIFDEHDAVVAHNDSTLVDGRFLNMNQAKFEEADKLFRQAMAHATVAVAFPP